MNILSSTVGKALVGVSVVSVVLCWVLGRMLMSAHEQIGFERENCNTRILEGIAEAEKLAKNIAIAAAKETQERMTETINSQAEAIAELEARNGEIAGLESNIERLLQETERDNESSCMDSKRPDAVIDGLRTYENCRKARALSGGSADSSACEVAISR